MAIKNKRFAHAEDGLDNKKTPAFHLKSLKCIKSYRNGIYGEGENGVTIAELKD